MTNDESTTCSQLRIGIVGGGIVGQAMRTLFGADAVVYDPVLASGGVGRDAINACLAAFVCVPTPLARDGSCDTSIVEEVIAWLATPFIVVRSTVAPGTTDRLRRQTGKRIIFQPEYLGQTPSHVHADMSARRFVVLGGPIEDASPVADLYKRYYNATVRFHFCDALTAELAKYMGNAFFAAKVAFVNEFYEIAKAFGVDFNHLREIWLADDRINPDHTDVYPHERGFGGKCLPKDLSAIIAAAHEQGYDAGVLTALLAANERLRPPVAPSAGQHLK